MARFILIAGGANVDKRIGNPKFAPAACDRFVAGLLEQRNDTMPVPRRPACSWDENEGGHCTKYQSRSMMPASRLMPKATRARTVGRNKVSQGMGSELHILLVQLNIQRTPNRSVRLPK